MFFQEDLVADMIAGLSVGIIHIPQGMGFALLAGETIKIVDSLLSLSLPSLNRILTTHCHKTSPRNLSMPGLRWS